MKKAIPVIDGDTGTVIEASDYYPFGKRIQVTAPVSEPVKGSQHAAEPVVAPVAPATSVASTSSPNRWHFSGKESQSFLNASIPLLDFGARMYNPAIARWTAADPLSEKYYGISPYVYCANNSICLIDGMRDHTLHIMTGRKYDYSNELAQDAPQSENEERKVEARTRRLEERSTSLADEFRDRKPEIGRVYNLLQKLVSQTGAFATTMLNLHDLLKNDLPIRFSEEDRKIMQDELTDIVKKTAEDIRKNEKRVSIPQAVFSSMVILLILLSVFFALVIFANRKLIHSDILT